MDPQTQQIIIVVAVIVIVALLAFIVVSARRRKQRDEMRERYGAEYDRTVHATGGKRAAMRDFKEREEMRSELSLHDLNDADRDLIRRHMASLQYRFVEDPADVMLQTDRVATEVLRAQGYPVAEDRDRALKLFSVDHPSASVAVRAAMEGNYNGDIAKMRETFLGVRRTLQEVTGVSYALGDATDNPGDLRVERGQPASAAVTERSSGS